jgi:hypothetical protein
MVSHTLLHDSRFETSTNPNQSAIRLAVCWILAVSGIFAVALALEPAGKLRSEVSIVGTSYSLPDLCQFKQIFGRDCPGCGLTRSFIYTARFQFANAWSIQPIGTLLAICLAATVPYRIWQIHHLRRGQCIRNTTNIEVALVLMLAVSAYARWFWNLLA